MQQAGGDDPADVERLVPEPAKLAAADRSPYQRDRARVLHSSAFRRLAAKTQVVGVGEDDFPRTRLTHSLECAQVGRELGAALGCDPDLVDTGCLAHDLGHPPFGHNGETALDDAAAGCGGFEGNAQSLRVLTRLEAKVLTADGCPAGLNLTRAALDAATKYPWPRQPGEVKFGVYGDDLAVFSWLRAGAPQRRRCLEAQVMDWADDIAYSVHDLEDGVHSGLVDGAALDDPHTRAELCELTAAVYSRAEPTELAEVLEALLARPEVHAGVVGFDGSARSLAALSGTTSELIGRFSLAALRATRAEHGDGRLTRYGADLVVPAQVRAECALLKGITARFVMQRPGATLAQAAERELVTELVAALDGRPDRLDPLQRAAWAAAADDAGRRRAVVDQVARLTDTSARAWQARLVG